MTASLLAIALIPGYAEKLEREARQTGQIAIGEYAKGVKYTRNVLYVGLSITVLGALDFRHTKSIMERGLDTLFGAMGFGIAIVAAEELREQMQVISQIYNERVTKS